MLSPDSSPSSDLPAVALAKPVGETSLGPTPMAEAGESLYVLDKALAESATHGVWLGHERLSGRPVVIKLFEQEALAEYRREAAATLSLHHPNINRCLDTYRDSEGRAALVYEFINGGSLGERMERGQLGRAELLHCLHDVLVGLDHLHKRGLIHCDIKPNNILFIGEQIDQQELPAVRFLIADLGAASPLREANSGRHQTGSPAYAAPERLYNQFSYNSDLYSLGVIAFQALTGHLPFVGSPQDIYRAHLSKAPALDEITDPGLRDLVCVLMEKNPQLRVATANDALRAVVALQQYADAQAYSEAAELLRENVANVANAANAANPIDKAPLGADFTTTAPWPLAPSAPLLLITPDGHVEMSLVWEREVQQRPQQVVASRNGEVLALVQAGQIEFLNDQGLPVFSPVLLTGEVICSSEQQFYYRLGQKLVQCDPLSGRRRNLPVDLGQAVAMAAHQGDFAWLTQRSGHWLGANGQQISFKAQGYAVVPQLMLSEHAIWASEGHARHEVVQRDLSGKVLRKWTLDGPVLALAAAGEFTIALTFGLNRAHEHSIWILDWASSTRRVLPEPLQTWAAAQGALLGCTADGKLFRYRVGGSAEALGLLPSNEQFIAVTAAGDDLYTLIEPEAPAIATDSIALGVTTRQPSRPLLRQPRSARARLRRWQLH